MASYQTRRNQDRTASVVATVSLKGFKRTSKAFDSKEGAKNWAETLERELGEQRDHGGLRADVPTLKVSKLIAEYLADPETKALRTFDSVEPLLAWWTDKYGGVRVMEMNVDLLRAARGRLMPGRAVGTVNRYLAAMRGCWNFGQQAGLIPATRPWPKRLMLTEPKGRTRFLDDKELAALLSAAKAFSATMYAAIVVSLACGIRQGEMLKLKWADVDLRNRTLRITDSKNTDTRALHMPASAAAALKALRNAPVVSAVHVFVAEDGTPMDMFRLIGRWKKIHKAAKLSDFRWHDLRHSCASFLAQAGGSLPEIAHVLGHRSTVVTARYSHLVKGRAVTGHRELDAKLQGAMKAGEKR